jgi:hypothetical protein
MRKHRALPQWVKISPNVHSVPKVFMENTAASSAEQREVGCIKKGGTRVSETALEPQLIKVI